MKASYSLELLAACLCCEKLIKWAMGAQVMCHAGKGNHPLNLNWLGKMSVHSFRKRLKAAQSRLHREQLYRAWSSAVGIIALLLAIGLSGFIPDVGFPSTADQWLYLAWVFSAWLGCIGLLIFGLVPEPSRRVRGLIFVGLWAGNIAVATGVTMAPPALIVLLLPVVIGAIIIWRAFGNTFAVIYLCIPFLAVVGSVVYQYYEATAI
ncbi:hypothetical protein [Microbulbifer discodermiae]|uniref:hypothetical protein n=1 Tax=Microbulbifer sp. 2201CG32-9 TaxID=3232309 RepID=UPI00345B74DE